MTEIQKVVKDMRAALGVEGKPASLRDVAKYLGVNHMTVNNWLDGVSEPNEKTVIDMVYGLEVGLTTAKKLQELVEAEPVEKS